MGERNMVGHQEESNGTITNINVIPLVDVMLVLLIIFMLTASFISSPSLPIATPKAYTADTTAPRSESLVLSKDGTLNFRNKKMDVAALETELKSAASLDPEVRVVLSADGTTPHSKIVELLDMARRCGVKKLALGVTKP
jgi:biopolymer transport protein ExbD